MEESTKDQIVHAGPDNQGAPKREQGDDDEMTSMKEIENVQPYEYYITVARASIDVVDAKTWVIFLKRIYGPLKRSVELFKEHSVAESTTRPELAMISANPSPSDDRMLAAKQRIQSAHLFLHTTILDGHPRIPDIPTSVFHGRKGTERPIWWRLKFGMKDQDWFTTRNHLAHSFGIPPEARPPNTFADKWGDDIKIFKWVQDLYADLELAVKTLIKKFETALNDRQHWTQNGDNMRLDLDELEYRQDIEEAELIWRKYLKETQEKYEEFIRVNETIQKAIADTNYTQAEKSEAEPDESQAAGWGRLSPTFSEHARETALDDVTDAMISGVTNNLRGVVVETVRAAVKKAMDKAEAGTTTEATAKTIIPAAKDDILEAIMNALNGSKKITRDALGRAMFEVLKVEEALEDGSLEGFPAGTTEVEGTWMDSDAPDPGFTESPPS